MVLTSNKMYSTIVEVLCSSILWSDNMDFILPSNYHSIIATPLQILGCDFRLGTMLAESVLEVACDDIGVSSSRVDSYESSIRRNTDVRKGSNVEEPVFRLLSINDMDRLTNA